MSDIEMEDAEEDIINQTEVPEFKVTNKIILSIFTEKGGTGKTTNSFFTTISFPKGTKVLVIDADPQSNFSHCVMSPTVMRHQNWYNVQDLILGKQLQNLYKPGFFIKNDYNITIIVGTQIDAKYEAMIKNEQSTPELQPLTNQIKKTVVDLLGSYDVIIIDMNPTYSAMNSLLLSISHKIISLLTADIFSQSAVATLVQHHSKMKLTSEIYFVPSMIIWSRNTLKPAHKMFVQKIVDYVKERRADGNSFVHYAGHIRWCDSMINKKPLQLVKKPNSTQQDLANYKCDISRVLYHVVSSTQEPLDEVDGKFLWEKNVGGSGTKIYFLRDTKDVRYKVGICTQLELRVKKLNTDFRTKWEVVKFYKTTENVAKDIESKIKLYYSTDSDVGETIKLLKEEFEKCLPLLDDRVFIESLLLEM